MKYPETASRLGLALSIRNMIPQELADLSGVSKASISQYLNGSHKPSNISSGKMAKVLDVDPLWLMGFNVGMYSEAKKAEQEINSSKDSGYYMNPETARIAQQIYDDSHLRILFDAAADASPEQLMKAAQILKVLKGEADD